MSADLRGGRLVEHDRDKPPTLGGGTLVSGHTWVARSGYVIKGRIGRSFVAQPEGVSRFDGARPRPGSQAGCGRCLNTSLAT
jgi:hypothetical protein